MVDIGLAPVDGFRDRFQLAREPSTAPVLFSPFRAGATHVVQLGLIWIEQRGRQPAPAPRGHTENAAECRGREQHSGNIRV